MNWKFKHTAITFPNNTVSSKATSPLWHRRREPRGLDQRHHDWWSNWKHTAVGNWNDRGNCQKSPIYVTGCQCQHAKPELV